MNSLERVMKALNREVPDRVPIVELGASEKVWRELYGCESYYEFQSRVMDYDMQYVRVAYEIVESEGKFYKDEWGIGYQRTNGETTGHSVFHPIREPKDIDKLILPDPDSPYRFFNLEQIIKDWKGEKAISFSSRAFFLWAAELVGLDNLLYQMMVEPEFCEEIFDRILENQIAVYTNAVKAGAEIAVETDDYAYNIGPFMSHEMFDEMIVPRITRFTEAMHKIGAKVVKHTDGNVRKILDLIVKCGVDAFQSVDPSAGMDIGEVKRLYGDKIAIIGNIDCGNVLAYSTPEEVRQIVKDTIRVAAPGGGYMLSSSNTLITTTKKENLDAMMETAREFGVYPINL